MKFKTIEEASFWSRFVSAALINAQNRELSFLSAGVHDGKTVAQSATEIADELLLACRDRMSELRTTKDLIELQSKHLTAMFEKIMEDGATSNSDQP